MTIIKRITAKGFKSFANKTELVFGKKFNCILGPNGSGKSNICDQICFVLGKSSAKSLRAEKSGNLIYNGGKNGKPASEAVVSIEFDNSNNKFPAIKEDTVKITRILKPNGQSTYQINDKTHTRQQIVDLLRQAKLDPDGHNIVLQGDIIHFMEMKPLERRELIENISGISTYEEKKNKCLNELQKVDEKLNNATIILTEREANLRELKKERDQAKRYKELEKEIKDHKATHIHLQIKNKQLSLEEIESKIKENSSKIESVNKTIEEYKSKIETWKKEIKEINTEVEEKGEKEQIQLRKEIDNLKENIIKANSRIENCEKELERIKTRKSQLEENIKEIDSKTNDFNKRKNDIYKRLEDEDKNEKQLVKQIKDFKEKNHLLENLTKSLDNLEEQIEDNLKKIADLQLENQEVQRKCDQTIFLLKNAEEKLNNIKGHGESKEYKDLQFKHKEISQYKGKLSQLIEQDSKFAVELATSRRNYQEINQELTKLTAKQIGINERISGDKATKEILKHKGTHGTVAQLGEVPPKYSLALEIAAGQRIHSVVVDTDETAQKCIEYLKQNFLGVVTFLPLNKIKSRIQEQNIKSLLQQPGVEGLATEIIQYDPKYNSVFSYVFGSTIIVKDLTTARKIGVGNARMVTLEGDLLEPSGAMIGGYLSQKKSIGSFKDPELEKQIKDNTKNLELIERQIKILEEKRTKHEEEIQTHRQKIATLEVEITSLEKSLNIHEIDLNKLTQEHKHLSSELQLYESKLQSLVKEQAQLTQDNFILKQEKSKIRQNDPKITEELNQLETEKQKIRESMILLDAEIKNINSQISNMLLPEKEKITLILKQQDKEKELFLQELNELKIKYKENNDNLKQKEKQEVQYHGRFKDLITKRNKVTEKIQNQEKAIILEQEKQRNIESKNNNLSIDRAKVIAYIEGLEKEFELYKDGTIKRGIELEELTLKIREFEKEVTKIGNVNLRALEVYEEIQQEHQKLVEKVTELRKEKDDVLLMMQEVEDKKKVTFMKTYKKIHDNFTRIFNDLTTKGSAHMELEDEENPFNGGIEMKVRIAGNKYLDLKSLSGGEKTMAALAMIFAIQEYEPSPFYLLDEVDAALDKKNSETLSKLIQRYSDKAQYIVISHNDTIITEADQIYGVSMKDGISKVISLKV